MDSTSLIVALVVALAVIFILASSIRVIRQQRVGMVERLGRFNRTLEPGPHLLIPVLDKVRLLTINDRGVLLSGYEMHPPRGSKGSVPIYPQTSGCVTSHGPAISQLSPADRGHGAGEGAAP